MQLAEELQLQLNAMFRANSVAQETLQEFQQSTPHLHHGSIKVNAAEISQPRQRDLDLQLPHTFRLPGKAVRADSHARTYKYYIVKATPLRSAIIAKGNSVTAHHTTTLHLRLHV